MVDVSLPFPYPAPHGRTSRRLEWAHLPPFVRDVVEDRIGTHVLQAQSQTSGFTPGFASVLAGADGTRHFVKAASVKAQRMFAESYREEARKLGGLPEGVPAPRLLWTHDADDWVVLGIEHVEARAPHRPWNGSDLDACLQMLARTVELLTPPPDDLELDSFATEFGTWPVHWDALCAEGVPHAEEARDLAARFVGVTAGSTLVHTDVRDDNILIRADGSALMCDWNWPVLGAAWLDSLFLLIGPRGDGVDVETVLATHPTFADVPAESIDIVLALIIGYFFHAATEPVPTTSPHIRAHQRWQGDVLWHWLGERRGWA